MLTSEAAIKAIIESVIKKSDQSNQEPEQITTGPSENLSQPLNSNNHNLMNGINLQDSGSAGCDLEDNPTEHYNSSPGATNAETEPSGKKISQIGERNANTGNLEEAEKEQICKVETKKTTIQVDISIYFHVNLNIKYEIIHRSQDRGALEA